MEATPDGITLTEGLFINWGVVKTLKVLNQKLFIVLHNDLIIEVTGLPPRIIDAAFAAYSKFLTNHHPAPKS